MKNKIAASILSANFGNLESELRQCETAGVDWIHFDVMDNVFVPNLTMGPFIAEFCNNISQLPIDCHLMVTEPEKLVVNFVNAGADYLTIHPEDNPNTYQTLKMIRELECHPGLAINPETSLDLIIPFIDMVDLLLIMTVHPGFSGQSFISESALKVQSASKLIKQTARNILLEVDGGISPTNISLLRDAGANVFVSATSIFRAPGGIISGVNNLRDALLK